MTISEFIKDIAENKYSYEEVEDKLYKYVSENISDKFIELSRLHSDVFLCFDNMDEVLRKISDISGKVAEGILGLADNTLIEVPKDMIIRISFPKSIQDMDGEYKEIDIDTIRSISKEIKDIISNLYDTGKGNCRVMYAIRDNSYTFEEKLNNIFMTIGKAYYSKPELSVNEEYINNILYSIDKNNKVLYRDIDNMYNKYLIRILLDVGLTIDEILETPDDELEKIIDHAILVKGQQLYFANFMKVEDDNK